MRISLKNFIIPSIPLAVFLVGCCFVLWLLTYVGTTYTAISTQNTSIVENLQSIFFHNSFLLNLVCIVLTLLNGFLVAQINNRFTIIRVRTFLPILIFLMLIGTWSHTHIMVGSHLALTLFILALFYFFSMSRDRKASEQAFMGSLLISMSGMLINPLLFVIPVCWIGFIMFQSFSLRTFMASVFGVLSPWILYLSGMYFFYPGFDIYKLINLSTNIDFNYLTLSLSEILYMAVIGIIMVISIVGMYSVINSDAIKTRNKLNFILFLLIFLLVLSFVYKDQFISFLPFIAFVYSMLISHPLTLKQNNFYGILFIIFCLINIAFVISKYFIL